jgi:hypothetical protein
MRSQYRDLGPHHCCFYKKEETPDISVSPIEQWKGHMKAQKKERWLPG